MVRAMLYDQLGYVVGEPDIPANPSPQVVIWGDDTYIAGCPDEQGRPCYYRIVPYIILDTRELPIL